MRDRVLGLQEVSCALYIILLISRERRTAETCGLDHVTQLGTGNMFLMMMMMTSVRGPYARSVRAWNLAESISRERLKVGLRGFLH